MVRGQAALTRRKAPRKKKKLPADVGVTNRRPSSDSELISRMEMRLLACVTRGPSREPYRKRGLFHIRYFENRPLEPGYEDPPPQKSLTQLLFTTLYHINHIQRTFRQADHWQMDSKE